MTLNSSLPTLIVGSRTGGLEFGMIILIFNFRRMNFPGLKFWRMNFPGLRIIGRYLKEVDRILNETLLRKS